MTGNKFVLKTDKKLRNILDKMLNVDGIILSFSKIL